MKTTARALLLVSLLAASLACNALYRFTELEGPEDRATDAFPFATATPVAPPAETMAAPLTAEPGSTAAAATGAPPLPFTLDEADEAQAALRDEFDDHVDELPDATRYVIAVRVSFDGDEAALLEGRSAIRYTNTQDFPLDEIYLMLWPNEDTQYLGAMRLDRAWVNGEPVDFELEHGGLAARLPLEAPLEPGAQVDIETEFTVQAEAGVQGCQRFGLTNGVLLAPTFYPLIPLIVEGEWQAEPPPVGGDTTNSETAFYAYRVEAPAGLQVVGSGSVVDSQVEGETQTEVLVTGPMRDLALVVGELERSQVEVDDITVNAYLLPRHADEADELLEQAQIQMETLQRLVGPYPFEELDIVDAPGACGGVEYPGLVFIGVIGEGFYEEPNVHEIGHQWFYSLIGDDQWLEPWLDEAAASYTEVLYYESRYGQAGREAALENFWNYLEFSDYPELPIGLPVGEYPDPGEYGLLVYGKGALFFEALRQELGDEVFFEFLQNYYGAYRYDIATSQGFQAVAETTCDCDLDELFELWVYEGGEVRRP